MPVGHRAPRLPRNIRIGPQVVWVALRCWPMQVLGAFATEQEASDVCENMNDVIGPMEIGKPLTEIVIGLGLIIHW